MWRNTWEKVLLAVTGKGKEVKRKLLARIGSVQELEDAMEMLTADLAKEISLEAQYRTLFEWRKVTVFLESPSKRLLCELEDIQDRVVEGRGDFWS